jgi:magnesium-transporting ATPase (P-type)
VIAHYDIYVGALSLGNFYLFGYLINKPYSKFASYAVGCVLAMIYLDLLEYRKIKDEEEKKKYPILNFFKKKAWISWIMIFVFLGLILLVYLISFPEVENPDAWN